MEQIDGSTNYELLAYRFSLSFVIALESQISELYIFPLSLVSFPIWSTSTGLSNVIDNFLVIAVITIDFEPVLKFYFYRFYSKFSKFREHNLSTTFFRESSHNDVTNEKS